ncbi:hypothetical protein F2P56_016746 [Juglans regia]|uniref:Uncharacterized protein n=1 Tax=Juglans regia TaxID=51240 RepID=A0A834CWW8_JUGRE|nr:hypothetical protein F2P56_016746 [Juglans regia]
MDEATVMGGPVWEGARSIEGDGPRLASPEAGSVGVTLLRVIPFLASPFLLLAPPCLWPVPQLQGVSVAWGIWHILWSTLWKERSLGDRIPFWVYQRSSVRRKHYESSRMYFFGALSVHSPLVTGLYLHDSSGIEGRFIDSCKDNLVIIPTAKIVLGSIYLYAHNLQGACFACCY